MAGEERYISPIIDAFLRRRQQDIQQQQEGVANQQKQQSLENENKYREALVKEAQSRLENAHEEHLSKLELDQLTKKYAGEKALRDNMQGLSTAIRNAPPGKSDEAATNYIRSIGGQATPKGSNPLTVGGETTQGSPTTQLTLPGQTQSFGTEGIPTGEEAATAEAGKQGSIAGAKSNAVIGDKLLLDTNKANIRHQNDMDLSKEKGEELLKQLQAKGATAKELQDMKDKLALTLGNAHNSTTLKAAQLHMGMGIDANTAGSMAELGHHVGMEILDGKGDWSKYTLPQKNAAQSWAIANGIELPKTPGYGQTISAMDSLPGLYDKIEDAINKYSVDSPQGGKLKALASGSQLGQMASKDAADMASAINQIKANAGQLALQNDPKARQTMGIITSQALAAINPLATKETNLKNFNDAKARNSQKLDNDVFNGIPKDVADTVKVRHGLMPLEPPAGITTTPARPGQPHPTIPGATLNGDLTRQAGHNVWDLPQQPTQSPTAVPSANPQPTAVQQ